MIAVDIDAGKIWWGKNGTWDDNASGTGVPATGAYPTYTGDTGISNGGEIFFAVASGSGTLVFTLNCGQDSSFAGNKTAQGNQDGNSIGDFYYTPPSGFLALCTSNLPAVAVTPSEHFNTVLYTGNGSTQSITGVGFQPDFSWFKQRSGGGGNHALFDVVRGVTKMLPSDLGNVEETQSGLTAFNSDGFSLGAWSGSNNNTETFVAWNWKAGGSGSSNTDGSVTTSVSANADAGFSIISYTGSGSGTITIGHGLSKAPEMWTVKARDDVGDNQWFVCHKGFASDYYTDFIHFDTTGAVQDSGARWGDTAPTSSIITIGSASTNESGDYICYAWHSVDGYSKVGSYEGNTTSSNTDDGTYVYLGFRPAVVLVKASTRSEDWGIYDNKRIGFNPNNRSLYPNSSNAEHSSTNHMDFLSNGFKLYSDNHNYSGGGGNSYIYLAFAETPFKYSNAR